MAQDRKVFVGGVPQDLNQDDLYAIFSEYAGVKKAWLQKCRATDDNGTTNPPQNHRGFGFVIFHDPNAIEELLGGSLSRFIVLRSGAKLEVKRALSSSKMSGVNSRPDAPLESSLVLSAGAGRGQPPTPQSMRAGAEPLRQRQAAAALPSPHGRLGTTWPSQDGSVLSKLSLMPNSTPAYPNADLRAKATTSVHGLMPASSGLDRGGGGLMASDGAPLSYGMLSQPLPPQPILLHQGLLCPPGSTGAPVAGTGEQRVGASQGSADRGAQLRESIVQFYQEHQPDKLRSPDFLDSICSYYKGREGELDESLRRKYGSGLVFSQGGAPSLRPTTQGVAPARQIPPAAVAATVPGPSSANSVNHYVQLGTGNGQANVDPMYLRQLSAEPSWLHPGLQSRPPVPQQAPPPQPGTVISNSELLAGAIAASSLPAGLSTSAPGLFPNSSADLASYPATAATAMPSSAAGVVGSTAAGGGGSAQGVQGPGGAQGVQGPGDAETPAEKEVQNAGPAHGQGADEGFEISVEVAESIVGQFT